MISDEFYMHRSMSLARHGLATVSPNPMVGCVVVSDGQIIGEGYHQRFGEAHAEVNAIRQVEEQYPDAESKLKQATVYVTLEPCSHQGKTPPCADLLVRCGVKRVVVGCRDPFAPVNGRGIAKLIEAGIEVTEGVLEDECRELNKRFFTRITKQRPYIILKWAQTANGFFAPENSVQKWISSPESKQLVHRWRSEEDAVLIGKNTALADNPRLNVREWTGSDPLRIVVDRNLTLPQSLNIFDQSQPTIIFNSVKTDIDGTIKYLSLEDFDHYLPELISYQLYLMDVQSLIVEGGAMMLNLFLSHGLWDEARIFTAPLSWESGIPAPQITGQIADSRKVGYDSLNVWLNRTEQ